MKLNKNDILYSFQEVLEYAIQELNQNIDVYLCKHKDEIALLSVRVTDDSGCVKGWIIDDLPVDIQKIVRLIDFVYGLVAEKQTKEGVIVSLMQIASLFEREDRLASLL